MHFNKQLIWRIQYLKITSLILILAKHQSDGAFRIVNYYDMINVKSTDIERITTKYDCDCTVSILYLLTKYMLSIIDKLI